MIRYEYNSENFDRNNSEQYTLSILLGMDSVVFAVADQQDAVVFVKDLFFHAPGKNANRGWLNQLADILQGEDQYLGLSYKAVKILVAGNEFIFVPERLFNADAAATYLSQAVELTEEKAVAYSLFPDLHSNLVYSFSTKALELFRESHPAATVEHLSTGLRNAYVDYAAHQPASFIGLHFRGNLEYITVYQNGFIKFHHCYQVNEGQNGLYFLLLVADTLQLDVESTPVIWSGDLVADSALLNLVKRYFRTVKPIDIGPFGITGLEEGKYLEVMGSISA